ncbi:MAG: hypothetical protein QOE13_3021 [Gaiellaceae bacterium]|jgi:hypothetical protein|nr:hypothetical protein [Gaiellaceae bacterium]
MSRIRLLLVAAIAALALLSLSATAVAAPPSCVAGVAIPTSSVTCSGTLTGLPPNTATNVSATLAYACANAFHRDPMTAVNSTNLVTDAHGNLVFNLTVTVPACKTGLVPVISGVTIVATQATLDTPLIVELPVL